MAAHSHAKSLLTSALESAGFSKSQNISKQWKKNIVVKFLNVKTEMD